MAVSDRYEKKKDKKGETLAMTMPSWVVVVLSVALMGLGAVLLLPVLVRIPGTLHLGGLDETTKMTETIASPARLGTQVQAVSQTKTTTTESGPSDALLLGLAGSGIVLFLAGAFFSRITKITLPDGTEIDVDALKKATEAIADLDAEGKLPAGTTVAHALAAASLAAAEGSALVRLSRFTPKPILRRLKPLDRQLTSEEVDQLVETGSPPDELWQQLAEAALLKVNVK